jgi:acetylornithine deacetylase/succinyl-diaminopimelate desuccinylase-like protein
MVNGREEALAAAGRQIDDGRLLADLRRRVAYRSESGDPACLPVLFAYLTEEIGPTLARLGFTWTLIDNPVAGHAPFLLASRHEHDDLPTVLTYAHGDVVGGDDACWRAGLSPWTVTVEGDRWYGRGTADNKGQHSLVLAALDSVLQTRGVLGCNVKVLMEMGEELGSPGLRAVCQTHREALAADVLIASDGPRLRADQPTLFLGSRGCFNFDLVVNLRDAAQHSGNWGGLLANPGVILAHAIAGLVDVNGRIRVPGLLPPAIPDSVRRVLANVTPGEDGGPILTPGWGEPGLSAAERVFAWNSLEVLAFQTGTPDRPVNAIPSHAWARMQLRFVVGTDTSALPAVLAAHLAGLGLGMVQVRPALSEPMPATRLDPDNSWVTWAAASITATTGRAPTILPNIGASLPNDCFAEVLGLPTLWVPHSYPGCAQHAPDEHLPVPLAHEGLRIMTGLFWDLSQGAPCAGVSDAS